MIITNVGAMRQFLSGLPAEMPLVSDDGLAPHRHVEVNVEKDSDYLAQVGIVDSNAVVFKPAE